MTTAIIITLCVLVIISYVFDLTFKHTKIPSVILLLMLGWGMQQVINPLHIALPPLKPLLPILGTIGLILIVLEGGLDLELDKSKNKLVAQISLSALLPIVVLSLGLGITFNYYSGVGIINSIINALPLCVVSSAIAIPSVQNLPFHQKEFVVYESSLSDIFGVILFNFFTVTEVINFSSVYIFAGQISLIIIISVIASIVLAWFIQRIDHHVKFVPIVMMVILIYAISKIFHLPSLIFILVFGLFLNNLDKFKHLRFIRKLESEKLATEADKFKEIVAEMTFLVRTMFFLLFGFLIDTKSILDVKSILIALTIVGFIFFVRFCKLKIFDIKLMPLLFIAPRGLITILLFLSIPVSKQIPFVTEALMVQVVLFSALFMMVGLMFYKTKPE